MIYTQITKQKIRNTDSLILNLIIKKILLSSKIFSFHWKKSYFRVLYNTNFLYSKKLMLLTNKYQLVQSQLFRKIYFLKKKSLSHFFFIKKINFSITIKVTKYNIFLSWISNINLPSWRLFKKKKNNFILKKRKKQNELYNNYSSTHATFSAGQMQPIKIRKNRKRYEYFDIGSSLMSFIISIFWSCLTKLNSRQFKFSIKMNKSARWIQRIMYSLRSVFKKLYLNHKWYLFKFKKKRKNQILKEFDKQEHKINLMLFKKILKCPLFLEYIKIIPSIPHNGCRLKKRHIHCKSIKRINSKRRRTR